MPIKRTDTHTPLSVEWIDSEGCLLYGKHKGESVQSLSRFHPDYLEWLIGNVENMHEDDRMIISQYLSRR